MNMILPTQMILFHHQQSIYPQKAVHILVRLWSSAIFTLLKFVVIVVRFVFCQRRRKKRRQAAGPHHHIAILLPCKCRYNLHKCKLLETSMTWALINDRWFHFLQILTSLNCYRFPKQEQVYEQEGNKTPLLLLKKCVISNFKRSSKTYLKKIVFLFFFFYFLELRSVHAKQFWEEQCSTWVPTRLNSVPHSSVKCSLVHPFGEKVLI